MRFLFAWFVVLSQGCLFGDEDMFGDDGSHDTGVQCVNGLCVTPGQPFRFGPTRRFAAATEIDVAFSRHTSIRKNLEITTDDPTVLQIRVEPTAIIVRGLQPGTASLIARDRATGETFASRLVETGDVATIDFTWRSPPISDAPVTRIAALFGSLDDIGVVLRDATGAPLAGRAPVTTDAATVAIDRVAPWTMADGSPDDHMRFGLRGAGLGNATATLTLFDGRTAQLSVEVVDAPATLDIALIVYQPDGIVALGDLASAADVVSGVAVARTADARFVTGVFPDWQSTGSTKLYLPEHSPEVQLQFLAPGPVDLIARTAGRETVRKVTAR